MQCMECNHEAPISGYRYLYNARIDASTAMRQCPACQAWLAVDQLNEKPLQAVGPGEAPWGKSAGIENLAED